MSDDEEESITGLQESEAIVAMKMGKYELVAVRIGKACLISSILLFVGLIIIVATSDRTDASSLTIGFVISLAFFLIWRAIHGVYDKVGNKSLKNIISI
jgi:hypothetical protein